MLQGSEEDFLVGRELCKTHNIKPARLLNDNILETKYYFKYEAGELTRRVKSLIEVMRPYQIKYNQALVHLQNALV